MKKRLKAVRDMLHPRITFLTYTNERSNIVKNGGCTVYLNKRPIAYLYAIVDSSGEVIFVYQKGVFAFHFRNEMQRHLMALLIDVEEKKTNPRNICLNTIDSPLI